ncbi:MAG: Eco57I restriction-modification methylase domain-containing protein [Bacteroidales bacterium]
MKNKKLTGSYYTPKIIADFLVDYLSNKIEGTNLSILEPSSGDGIFIKAIFNHTELSSKIRKVIAVERDKEELEKVKSITKSSLLKTINSDFLDFQNNNTRKFNLVIGNPPYIKKKLLELNQVVLCEEIHKSYPALSKNKIKNIWTSFLIRSIKFVSEDGILAFVLPSELLQVKFAEELRTLILNEFERVEIFTFNELLFKDCKGQDTLLLIGERKSKNKGVFYCNIEDIADLKDKKFTLSENVNIRDSKWTHHHLTTDEIELLEKVRKQLKIVNHYCTSKAGIVTGANNFFIVDNSIVNEYSLQQFIKPIIQKGSFVNGSVILSQDDFEELVKQSKPTSLIVLNNSFQIEKNEKIKEYLDNGETLGINTRYKASIRTKWYEVPNIGVPPEAFFFKRCNEYPKLIKNSANVLATDSAYTISMNEDYSINNLIFSFYNSLSLSFAELNGRYYGGGVLELTPNEFKNLPVPYLNINTEDFNTFINDFKEKKSIKDICKKNDTMILKSIDVNIDSDNIDKIFHIREKLFLRRIKTN